MSDISTIWDTANSRADWWLSGADLAKGSDLATAILISLFTDREAAADDEIPDSTADRRGWWADDDTPIGSKLWLLERAKQSDETLQRAFDYIVQALQWMIDDGAVAVFDITVSWLAAGQLGAEVVAKQTDGSVAAAVKYTSLWSAIN